MVKAGEAYLANLAAPREAQGQDLRQEAGTSQENRGGVKKGAGSVAANRLVRKAGYSEGGEGRSD